MFGTFHTHDTVVEIRKYFILKLDIHLAIVITRLFTIPENILFFSVPQRHLAVLRFTRLKTAWPVGTPESLWHMPVPAGLLPKQASSPGERAAAEAGGCAASLASSTAAYLRCNLIKARAAKDRLRRG